MKAIEDLKAQFDYERGVLMGAVEGCALTNELYLRISNAYYDACEAFRRQHKLSRLRCRPSFEDIQKYLSIYRIEINND
jgi:hypothetical protein